VYFKNTFFEIANYGIAYPPLLQARTKQAKNSYSSSVPLPSESTRFHVLYAANYALTVIGSYTYYIGLNPILFAF